MRVENHMTEEIASINPGATVREAAEVMRKLSVGSVLLTDEDGRIDAILTDRDLCLRVIAEGLPSDTPAHKVASRPVIQCGPEDQVADCIRRMRGHGVRRLPVTQKGRGIGMLALDDVVAALAEALHDVGVEAQVRRRATGWRLRMDHRKEELESLYEDVRDHLRYRTWYSQGKLLDEIDDLKDRTKKALAGES